MCSFASLLEEINRNGHSGIGDGMNGETNYKCSSVRAKEGIKGHWVLGFPTLPPRLLTRSSMPIMFCAGARCVSELLRHGFINA